MTEAAREVLELALNLPLEERARIARLLCESLAESEPAPPAVEGAWRDEIRQRLEDVKRDGEAYASWEETLVTIERRLEERRRAKQSG